MPGVTIKITGLDRVTKKLADLNAKIAQAADNEMQDFMNLTLLAEAKDEIPKVSSTAARATQVRKDKGGYVLGTWISYGWYLHEGMPHHTREPFAGQEAHHAPPTKSHFLIDPVNRHRDELKPRLINAVMAAITAEAGK